MIFSEILRKWLDLEIPRCESCETLRKQLEIANFEKKQLLDNILAFTTPKAEEKLIIKEIEPIRPRAIPFSVKRQMLEDEDRAKAEIMRRKEEEMKVPPAPSSTHVNDDTLRQDIEQLEKELGIENG